MRKKVQQVVVSFETTTQAMAFELMAKEFNIKGRLIPVPRDITAGCGLAWRSDPDTKSEIEELIKQKSLIIDCIYELII
ncbi:DUF3343 domain-containing protein [Alkalibacter mobilis]|uniref:DUF3343 domain-containing protein n=1 Tax=Alkalibacter mobilis TaxID=2787712 RepID=UPI00189E249C|nr:DUF3343 domain-containing protein [Alkalibacter mobilis]MBF7096470.1 DUF3343 domain-containing protein [Alkalibacter mobilis]